MQLAVCKSYRVGSHVMMRSLENGIQCVVNFMINCDTFYLSLSTKKLSWAEKKMCCEALAVAVYFRFSTVVLLLTPCPRSILH